MLTNLTVDARAHLRTGLRMTRLSHCRVLRGCGTMRKMRKMMIMRVQNWYLDYWILDAMHRRQVNLTGSEVSDLSIVWRPFAREG